MTECAERKENAVLFLLSMGMRRQSRFAGTKKNVSSVVTPASLPRDQQEALIPILTCTEVMIGLLQQATPDRIEEVIGKTCRLDTQNLVATVPKFSCASCRQRIDLGESFSGYTVDDQKVRIHAACTDAYEASFYILFSLRISFARDLRTILTGEEGIPLGVFDEQYYDQAGFLHELLPGFSGAAERHEALSVWSEQIYVTREHAKNIGWWVSDVTH